jgi:imidazoleglycerol-phosphate dehydratase
MSAFERETSETRIRVEIGPAGPPTRVETGLPFLDHMLVTFARYAGLSLTLRGTGDLKHHLIEDAAIVLGTALREDIPDTCARYGHAVIPMDDALVEASVDLGGRPYYRGPVPSRLYDHFFRSLCDNARITTHIRVQRGHDRHHAVEAAFKAFGLACRQALVNDGAVFSTKGAVRLERISGGGDSTESEVG